MIYLGRFGFHDIKKIHAWMRVSLKIMENENWGHDDIVAVRYFIAIVLRRMRKSAK